ncbi:MAG: hypothetical protein HYW47_04110 [Deltaproteobacteria bacterium]|nr:hypothetical protein [Deltaproteobacteria bacterium]
MRKIFFLILTSCMLLSLSIWAVDIDCDVCGMVIKDKAPNHFILKKAVASEKALNACSIPCVKKAKKSSAQYTKIEVPDFNHPGKFLDGEKAFFLIKSKNVKKDLGDMVMPPHVVAFTTKEEALASQKKYGDGEVVQGLEKALKEI